MSNKTLIFGALIFGIGLIVFSRIYISDTTPTSNSFTTNNSVSVGSVVDKNRAPDFVLQRLDGGTITLAEYIGEKPVILDFFATWCPNCRRDMPRLTRWYEKYKDQVEVIGINLQENPSKVEKYISSAGISFPIALDPHGQASQMYGVRYTNFHVLINKDGNIVKTVPGDIRESQIISLINAK